MSTAPFDFEAAIARALQEDHDPESHVEHNPETFHPSQIARCKRQAYLSKLGLLHHDAKTLGVFKTGTLIHEWLEDRLGDRHEHVSFEEDVSFRTDGITFVGRCDAHDRFGSAVYDFKTRASWYRFDPSVQRHIDQLLVYMAGLGVRKAQVVYLSKSKLEVRTWPEDGFFELDEERFEELVAKAQEIRDAVADDGLPTEESEIPFEKCGCYFCDQESLIDLESLDVETGGVVDAE